MEKREARLSVHIEAIAKHTLDAYVLFCKQSDDHTKETQATVLEKALSLFFNQPEQQKFREENPRLFLGTNY